MFTRSSPFTPNRHTEDGHIYVFFRDHEIEQGGVVCVEPLPISEAQDTCPHIVAVVRNTELEICDGPVWSTVKTVSTSAFSGIDLAGRRWKALTVFAKPKRVTKIGADISPRPERHIEAARQVGGCVGARWIIVA